MMCVRLWVAVLVYADFVNGIINPFAVRGQRKVMPATKPAEVTRSWRGSVSSEWCIFGGGVPNIVFGPSFCMAMFVK